MCFLKRVFSNIFCNEVHSDLRIFYDGYVRFVTPLCSATNKIIRRFFANASGRITYLLCIELRYSCYSHIPNAAPIGEVGKFSIVII
jgi:hypothetical protein